MKRKIPLTYILVLVLVTGLTVFDLLLVQKNRILSARLHEANLHNHALQSKLEVLSSQKPRMPHFTLSDLDGREFDSDALDAKLTLLIFFSVSDCPVCLEDAPFWEELNLKFGKRGLKVVGVGEAYDKEDLRRFASVKRLSFPILFDIGFEVKERFGDFATPAKVVLGSRREILLIQSTWGDVEEQQHDREEFTSGLERLLKTDGRNSR